jgi:hypothetical protein
MGNLLIACFLAILFGFILIYWIQKTSKPKETIEEKIPLSPALQNLTMDQFFNLCCSILERMGLKILKSYRTEENEVEVYAENPAPMVGGPFSIYLILYPRGAQVTSTDVQNFASNLIGERRGKGIIMTTGFFTPEVATLPELPPMEMIDGKQLGQLMEKYGISGI